MTWKDITNYSRDDKNRVPTSWELKTDRLEIIITKGHIYYPGEWVLHCYKAGFDTYRMKIKDDEIPFYQVQQRAIELVRSKLRLMLNSLPDPVQS